jgi:hypothetical protein
MQLTDRQISDIADYVGNQCDDAHDTGDGELSIQEAAASLVYDLIRGQELYILEENYHDEHSTGDCWEADTLSDKYQEQTRQAVEYIRSQYGLPSPGLAPRYVVSWATSVCADGPEAAAARALDILRGSTLPNEKFTVHGPDGDRADVLLDDINLNCGDAGFILRQALRRIDFDVTSAKIRWEGEDSASGYGIGTVSLWGHLYRAVFFAVRRNKSGQRCLFDGTFEHGQRWLDKACEAHLGDSGVFWSRRIPCLDRPHVDDSSREWIVMTYPWAVPSAWATP